MTDSISAPQFSSLQDHDLQGHGLEGHGLEGHGLEGHGLEGHGLELDGHALLVGSSGGHLAQLRVVADLWPAERRTWVTFDTPDAVTLLDDESVHWAHHPTTRSLSKLVRNTGLAWRVLRRQRPDVVLSTGAAVAFPFFVLARLLRIPTVYIEVYDRIDTPTLTGRLCRPFTSLFLVQWEEQRVLYPGAVVVGTLL